MAGNAYITLVNGIKTLIASIQSSAGAADAGKIPALNASGVLDSTIVNSKVVSAGAGDAGKIPALDSTGRVDTSVLPVGVGAETVNALASEALAAGDFVNMWNNTGVINARKADATVAGKEAHGFVLSAVTLGNTAMVYTDGQNTQCASLTLGPQFLSTTAGKCSSTPPSASGNIVQLVGVAVATSVVSFKRNDYVVLS